MGHKAVEFRAQPGPRDRVGDALSVALDPTSFARSSNSGVVQISRGITRTRTAQHPHPQGEAWATITSSAKLMTKRFRSAPSASVGRRYLAGSVASTSMMPASIAPRHADGISFYVPRGADDYGVLSSQERIEALLFHR
jgi:hypothetical protein